MEGENKRKGENKEETPIKIRFSTVILIVIIIVLAGFIIWEHVIVDALQESEEQLQPTSISETTPRVTPELTATPSDATVTPTDTTEEIQVNATPDTVSNNMESKNLGHLNPSKGKNIEPGITYEEGAYIDLYNIQVNVNLNKAGQVEVLITDNGKEDFAEDYVKNMKRKKETEEIMGGFSGKVEEIELAEIGQEASGSYFLFLMGDGSVEYISLVDLLDTNNLASRGKIQGLNNIVRIKNISARENEGSGWSTALAFDTDGNFYDVNNLLEKQGISSTTVN